MRTLYVDATVLDTDAKDVREGGWVSVDAGLITGVGYGQPPRVDDDAAVVDLGGATLMPGLIDAHIHIGTVENLDRSQYLPKAVHAARAFARFADVLAQGYTTVRDAGWMDASFRTAEELGLIRAPRMTVSNGPISITGGHSDVRQPEDDRPAPTGSGLFWPGVVADGVTEVRRAARELLRRGADHIKVMASGGTSTHQDDVTDLQFSPEELAVAVFEAEARSKYVLAHCYTPDGIVQAASAGVRSIEHGNFLDERGAAAMAAAGTFLVPTLMVHETNLGMAADLFAEHQLRKTRAVRDAGYEAIRVALDAGVEVGIGTDAGGDSPAIERMALSLEYQSQVMSPLETLVAATRTNARLMGLGEVLGSVRQGLRADLLVVDGNPVDDIRLLQDRSRIRTVYRSGRKVAQYGRALDLPAPLPLREEES